MKILVCDGMHEDGLSLLRAAEGVEVDAPERIGPEEIRTLLPAYDAMVVRSRTKVTADILASASRLKVIGRAGTGVDNIDVPAARARGVLVMNTPGANATAAAEHTLALMLALARHIPQAMSSVRSGEWDKRRFVGTELCGQTLGIIGLGRIGGILADRALGMKMEVLAHDPYITPEVTAAMGISWVPLDELLSRADFVTLHTPLTKETQNIINRDTLARMKRGARLINCARGGLVDEAALYDALVGGRLGGAALDVFAQEPPFGNPLLSLDNVVFTPHLGASSVQAQANVALAIASQILDYLQQGIIRNAVNFPSINPKYYEKIRPYLLLAERLGRLQGALCNPVERVEIEYCGSDFVDLPVQPLTQSVVKGLLDPILAEGVNLVSAPVRLKERNIELVATTTSHARGYTGLISVKVTGGCGESSAAGTVFPGEEIRLVRFNTYRLEAELEGINLIVQNRDRPGTVGVIGSTLGRYRVNIANMHLSRTAGRETAIAIIRLDEEAPAEALEVLLRHPNIVSVRQVTL